MTRKFLFFDWIFLQRKTNAFRVFNSISKVSIICPPRPSFFPSDAIGVLLCLIPVLILI